MAPRFRISAALLAWVLSQAACSPPPDQAGGDASDPRPNVLLIVADDMGYNELGAWGSEIRTPNLDRLAFEGLRFTNFHAAPTCAPARAMLLSGTTNHQAGVGSMDIKRAYDNGEPLDPGLTGLGLPGYVGHLSPRVAALPEILRDAGYHTYMSGKWDLGRALDSADMPARRGFEASFALTTGTAVHLGFPDGNASGGLPRADPYPYQENGVSVEELPVDFFSTAAYTDKLIEYIEANRGDGQPFFAWLAYTAPHLPIQVPDEWRDRYHGAYDEGYTVIRDRRLERAKELGIFPSDLDLSRYRSAAPAWDELGDDARLRASRVMELYAAMLENLDYHVGRLVDYLDETGQLQDTVILFMSDNGAAGGGIPVVPNFTPDNSLENMGRYDAWLDYGRGWAEAATAPFRDVKASLAEGGTRVAAFVDYRSVANPGSLDHGYLTFMDVAPTILEITGTPIPEGTFEGREIVPMIGKSFWSRVLGSDAPVHGPDEAIGAELHGNRALVRGDWKILMPAATGRWELYDLAGDPGETEELGGEFPELLDELVGEWERFAVRTGVLF